MKCRVEGTGGGLVRLALPVEKGIAGVCGITGALLFLFSRAHLNGHLSHNAFYKLVWRRHP
jgi:hypothetical protein